MQILGNAVIHRLLNHLLIYLQVLKEACMAVNKIQRLDRLNLEEVCEMIADGASRFNPNLLLEKWTFTQ